MGAVLSAKCRGAAFSERPDRIDAVPEADDQFRCVGACEERAQALAQLSGRFIDLIRLYKDRFTNSSFSLSIAVHLQSALYPNYSTIGGILQ